MSRSSIGPFRFAASSGPIGGGMSSANVESLACAKRFRHAFVITTLFYEERGVQTSIVAARNEPFPSPERLIRKGVAVPPAAAPADPVGPRLNEVSSMRFG